MAAARVLLVDDNEMNRDMLSRRLAGRGYEVAVAEDGERAIETIERTPFDILLLDVMMPGLSGFDVVERLRRRYSVTELPIVMVTSKDRSDDVVQALRLGANDFISKPVDFNVLLARIETQLALKGGATRRHDAPTPAPVGRLISRYEVVERIGAGGMGEVFLARDPRLGRLLAIKLIGEGGDYPDRRKRFEREAQSAAQLSHPNIVTIFDFGEHQDRPFIAMEFVPGETLAAKIAHREEMTFVRKLELMLDLCAGLAHAHRARIVHRDVKPANLMITPEGRLKILDFGIARINDADATRTGTLVGTPNYMAPEQLTGHGADTRTDIFAVGAVFYELVSYRQAFPGTIAGGVLARVLMNEPTPLAELCPDLDPAVALLIRQALEKDPARRPQDLEEMRGAVQAIHQRATHGVPVRGAAPLQEMR